MNQQTTIPSENLDGTEQFGMDSIKDVKYTPNKVKEVDGISNSVEIE